MAADEARICGASAEVGKPRLAGASLAAAAASVPTTSGSTGKRVAIAPSGVDTFNFDLNGFLVLKNALTAEEVTALNATLDAMPPLQPQEWYGRVHRQDYVHADVPPWGVNLQNIVEAGAAFENLIDHPSWLGYCQKFVGQEDLYIDENFVTIRDTAGTGSPLHSGAHKRAMRTQFRYHDGKFHCGEINILIALDDVGPDDGATVVR